MALDEKSSQTDPVNAGVPQGFIFGPTPFLLYIMIFPMIDLRDTVNLGRKWLVDFNAGKLNWFRLTGPITLVLLM